MTKILQVWQMTAGEKATLNAMLDAAQASKGRQPLSRDERMAVTDKAKAMILDARKQERLQQQRLAERENAQAAGSDFSWSASVATRPRRGMSVQS